MKFIAIIVADDGSITVGEDQKAARRTTELSNAVTVKSLDTAITVARDLASESDGKDFAAGFAIVRKPTQKEAQK